MEKENKFITAIPEILKRPIKNNRCIFLVWLSYKTSKNWDILEAFCKSTNSGKIINALIEPLHWFFVYKTNLVKWVPLDHKWKLRYPDSHEKIDWLNILKSDIEMLTPEKIFLFWKQVSDFIIRNLKNIEVLDSQYYYWKSLLIFVEHPSYIYVYKKKEIAEYIKKISELIKK